MDVFETTESYCCSKWVKVDEVEELYDSQTDWMIPKKDIVFYDPAINCENNNF